MRTIFLVIIVLFSSFLSTASDAPENDDRPGSRTIFVETVEDGSLKIKLRNKCVCGKTSSIEERRLCDCFDDLRAEDQPFVQGRASNVIFLINKECFPGFGCGQDKATEDFFIRVPTPERLLEILQKYKLDYIELVPGDKPVSIEQYFKFLSEKKIPVAKIPHPNEVENTSMLYHAYFHDIFNHLLFRDIKKDKEALQALIILGR